MVLACAPLSGCGRGPGRPAHLPASIDPDSILAAGSDGVEVVLSVAVRNPTDHSVHVRCSITYRPTDAVVGSFVAPDELGAGANRSYRALVSEPYRRDFGDAFVATCVGRP
jgi:hypothetical protein